MRYDVDISKNILNWLLSNLDPEKTNPGVLETLNEWKNEQKKPTYNKVLEISRSTGIPLGYFFLETPPKEDLSFVNYRTINSTELKTPSRELKTIMLDMELIQDWIRNQLISDGESKNLYVNSLKSNDITALAQKVRKELNIKTDWFKYLKTSDEPFKMFRTAISDSGVVVMSNSIVRNNTSKLLSIDEFRAFALIDDYAPLIFINTNDSANGKLFSLLHEYVHIGLGENSVYNDRCSCSFDVKTTETICNKVSAEILVPQEIFIKQWTAQNSQEIDEIIKNLSKFFKCGTTVIARKALENNYIDSKTYYSIAQNAVSNYKKNKSGGGSFYRGLNAKIDSNFLNLLFNKVEQGKTLYTEAFRLTNTNRKTFNELKTRFEGGLL